MMADDGTVTASILEWLGLIVVSAVSFWTQAVITEERFVPSLNVIATYFSIRSDVAGATLMAAGASSPELLASFTTLFVTHTSLGIGTIVGSEIFNQLMICSGSILAARNKQLHLSKAIVLREVSFYGTSLAFLMIALSDRRTVEGYDVKHIFISWWQSLLLFGGYIVYVGVCAFFEPIQACVKARWNIGDDNVDDDSTQPLSPVSAIVSESPSMDTVLPFLRLVSNEPSINFHSNDEMEQELYSHMHDHSNVVTHPQDATTKKKGRVARLVKFLVAPTKPKPSTIHGLEDRIWNDQESFSCFLWEQSLFYTKARVDVNAWNLRWFTFPRKGECVTSVPNRAFCKDEMRYPDFARIEVDEAHLILKMVTPGDDARDYVFMAPSEAVLLSVLDACQHMEHHHHYESAHDELLSSYSAHADAEVPPSLTKFPTGESRLRQMFHILLFPLKLLMQFTVPDPRVFWNHEQSGPRLSVALFSSCLCIVWLILGSYAMVSSLERLGDLLKLPDSVVGQTISAAGTSLPNYVASQVAARQGLGNMAVSNAFGSNTFNIFVGLGLPWLIWTCIFGEYSGLQDDGITESVLILVVVLVAFVLLIFLSNFVLHEWHSYAFLTAYASYVVWVVVQGYL